MGQRQSGVDVNRGVGEEGGLGLGSVWDRETSYSALSISRSRGHSTGSLATISNLNAFAVKAASSISLYNEVCTLVVSILQLQTYYRPVFA
jgi:hypothetical protein